MAAGLVQYTWKDGAGTSRTQNFWADVSGNLYPMNAVTDALGNILFLVANPGAVNIEQIGSANLNLGQTTMSGSVPSVIASDQTPIPVQPTDLSVVTGNITVVDAGSTAATNAYGQVSVTGPVTTGSFVAATLTGCSSARVELKSNSTFTGTVTFEKSFDAGQTVWWEALVEVPGASTPTATLSATFAAAVATKMFLANAAGLTGFRIRATAVSGSTPSLAVTIQPGYGVGNISIIASTVDQYVQGDVADSVADSGNPLKIGAVYNATQPTYTTGERATLQTDNRGNLQVYLATELSASLDSVTANAADGVPTTGTITAADAASASTAGIISGQTVITGTPTAGSAVTCAVTADSTFAITLSGTFIETLVFEKTADGTHWVATGLTPSGLTTSVTSVTGTGASSFAVLHGNAGGYAQVRVRCPSGDFTSGTVNVSIQPGEGVSIVGASQLGGPWSTSPTGATTGGATPYHLASSAASTNATSVKGSAGTLYGFEVFNTNAATRFLKIFDKATAPTLGTDTPIKTIPIPPTVSSALGGVVRSYPVGIALTNGLAYALTANVADSDNTGVSAGDVTLDLDYK